MGWFIYALIVAGMALYWPMLRRNALFYSLAGHDATPVEAVAWYTVFLLLVACAIVVCVRCKPTPSRRLTGVLGIVFAVQAACKAVEVLWHPGGAFGLLCALGSVGGFAVVLVALTCLWASACVSCNRRSATLIAIGSFAVSFFVKEIWALPGAVGVALTVLSPLMSLALWWVVWRQSAEKPLSDARVSPPASTLSLRPLVAILAVFLVAGGVVRGVCYGTPTGSSLVTKLPQDLLTLLFAGVLFGALALNRQIPKLVQVAWSVAALLVFAGLLVMVAYTGEGQRAGGELAVVGRTCLGLLFWIMLVDLVRSGAYSLTGAFGAVFLTVEVLSSFLGYIAVPEVMNMLDIATTNAVTFLLAAITFGLIVAMMVFFNRSRSDDEATESADVQASVDHAQLAAVDAERVPSSAEVFAAAGLTDREAEVALLLAEGNSQKKISELLSVSIGTVQSHIKAIYRKFDIHSRQEFIDALRREQA